MDAIAALVREEDEFIIATDARRKEIYWAKYREGKRVEGPSVDLPAVIVQPGLSIIGEGAVKYAIAESDEIQFPDLLALVAISESPLFRISEPMYLRRPDAVPTNERSN